MERALDDHRKNCSNSADMHSGRNQVEREARCDFHTLVS